MTHFKEQKAYTKPQEVSRNLKFITNNTTNVCFDFGGRISRFLPMLVGGHEKLTELSRKSYLEAWNPSLFIKFVIINTSNGFSYIKFNQTLPIFKPKKLLFFLKSWPHVCQLTNQKTKLHLNMTNDDQLKSWAWRTNSNMKKVNKLFFFAIMRWVTFSSVLLD